MWYTSKQKEIDVWIQDQVTPPFHRYFMSEDKTDIILTSSASEDDTTISVSSGHGFTAGGEYILINYGNYIQQSKVISVATDDITIESPLEVDLPISGTQIIRGSIEMNIDGSSTAVEFYCRPGPNADPVDIQYIHVFIRDASDGDQSTYGGISALSNGTFVRQEGSIDLNLGIYKTNSSFVERGGKATYNDKAPSGEYSQDFAFDLKEKYGIVLRLDPDDNGCIKVVVQDNLTGLTFHRIVGMGQYTMGE